MIESQCTNCNKLFYRSKSQYNLSVNHFCSHQCSATFNNKRRGFEGVCLFCNKSLVTKSKQKKFCNYQCQSNHQHKIKIEKWQSGESNGLTANGTVSPYVKRYLINKRGNECEKCGWAEINPSTHKVPIEANHIDGNWKNNTEVNIELICPNCHSLTPTYRSLNRGNGRSHRNNPAKDKSN